MSTAFLQALRVDLAVMMDQVLEHMAKQSGARFALNRTRTLDRNDALQLVIG